MRIHARVLLRGRALPCTLPAALKALASNGGSGGAPGGRGGVGGASSTAVPLVGGGEGEAKKAYERLRVTRASVSGGNPRSTKYRNWPQQIVPPPPSEKGVTNVSAAAGSSVAGQPAPP